jgi:phosphatidylglycerophosphate synthase
MRSADRATIMRTALIVIVLFLVIAKVNPAIDVFIFAAALVMDGVDGYLALRESSGGRIGIGLYIDALRGGSVAAKQVRRAKAKTAKIAGYGPRLDVAADRITEMAFWGLFAFLHVIPFFLFVLLLVRHSFVDAFMGIKGTSSKMKSGVAKALYSSNWSRALANMLKFVTFSYLMLEYVSGYPQIVGTALAWALAAFIVVRGIAEMYEILG